MLGFLRDLAARAKPFAARDRADLEQFAREQLGIDSLQAWDLAFAADRLKQARYSYSEQEVKQYFTEPKVLGGLFSVIEQLYGLRVQEDSAPVWHDD
uniref:M3 family metallopeptidase n=1 Tax=Enterobacter hormaechei TaxID=158836 RepID=UPI00203E55B3